jgi:polysaccharide transporter, PST family
MISPWMLRLLPAFLRRRIVGRSYLLKVIDNTGWIFAERALRHTIGFAVGIWIARYVGPEQYGLLNYAAAFVVVFSFMGVLGLDTVAVREMVRDPTSRDGVLGTLVVLRIIGGLVMVAVIAIAMLLVKPDDSRVYPLIVLTSVATLLLAVESIDCWFQANLTSYYSAIARVVSLLTAAAVRIGMIVLHAPLVAFAWATLAETALLMVAMLMVYRRSGERVFQWRPAFAQAKTLFERGWPLMLSAVVVAVSQRLDQVLVGELAGFAEVGAYAIAVRMVEATYIIPAAIAASTFPAMIKLKEQGNAQYELQMQRLCNVMLWAAFAIAVPLSALSGIIVRFVFGSAYEGAVVPLALLSWMPVFVFFNVVRQRWLLAEQAVPVALAVEVAACVLSVCANLLLVPHYGAAGAAMAALIGAGGCTFVVAPFSRDIRRSLAMMANGVIAPLRALRGA